MPVNGKRIMNKMIDMVKDKVVKFIHYADRELWYVTECGFEFPVPLDDIGNATFMAEDKAIFFMRYIRKHKEMLAEERKKHEQTS